MSTPRRGSLLILVAGLIAILVMLALAFLQRMRSEAAGSDLVVADTQARIMLHAACCYIQEAARVGYASSTTTVATGIPDPTDLAAFAPYGAASFVDYWSGNAGSAPAVSNNPPPADLSWFGTYGATATSRSFNEKNWVGWYTPSHRGQYLTPWHQQDVDVHSWLDSWRQAPAKWEPRLRSRPCYVLASPGASPDPNPGTHGDVTVSGSEIYYDGARAELVGLWPIASLPKLFQMPVLEEPPYAVYPHANHCTTAQMGALFDVVNFRGTGQPWLAPPQSAGAAVQGKATLATHVDRYPDPHLLYHPSSDKARWMGRSTVVDAAGVGSGLLQAAPRPNSQNLGWFRIYRETHDTFVITCGGGASNGWRIRKDGSGNDVIEAAGVDVISDTTCPYASVDELRDALDGEVRLWFRVCWQPSIRSSHLNKFFNQTCNQGGSFKYVQRLSEAQVAALPGGRW